MCSAGRIRQVAMGKSAEFSKGHYLWAAQNKSFTKLMVVELVNNHDLQDVTATNRYKKCRKNQTKYLKKIILKHP